MFGLYEQEGTYYFNWLVFFQAEDGIRDLVRSRGLGDVYKSQVMRNGASFEVLIEINRTIMQGLSPAAAPVPA